MIQIPEYLRLACANSTPTQLKARKAQSLDLEHGRTLADPAKLHHLDFPVGHYIGRDNDHGKVSVRIGPPLISRYVDLKGLADIQPYAYRRRAGEHMRRSQHQARRD